MKNLLILYILPVILLASCKKSTDSNPEITVTLSMESNSSNDVYYSFVNGIANSVVRTDWDIALSVPLRTASILINEGAGVELYSAGDTNAWATADTANLNARTARFNNKSDWYDGAFNIYSTGGINFGWGTYNGIVYNVYADSIFILKLTNGSYKKFAIKNKMGYTNTYGLEWSNLDGSGTENTTVSVTPDSLKNFIHYSVVNKKVVDAEPDKKNWDLLFTRYVVKVPSGPGTTMNYQVTGILINPLEKGLKVTGVAPENANYTDTTATFTTQADIIGWEWKISDPITHEISIAPNTSYFVKLSDGHIYRIYFTNYGGLANGTITFKTKLVE
jgi:hypothetical protein